ncbi:MAG: hypothetical protein AAF628_09370 [Planctomycetota bacterium]
MRLAIWLLVLPPTAALAWNVWAAVENGALPPLRWATALGAVTALALAALIVRGAKLPAGVRLVYAGLAAVALWLSGLEFALTRTTILARGLLGWSAAIAVYGTIALALARGPGQRAEPKLALRLGVFAAMLLLSLFAVETLLRRLFPVQIYEIVPDNPRQGSCLMAGPNRRPELRPGFTGQYMHPEFPELRIEINDWGLRDDAEEASEPEPGSRSVLVLGDSFAFGTGVRLEETFQEVLEQRAPEITDAPLRVYGAGVTGYGPDFELDLLRELAPKTQPNAVVVAVFEGNDFQDNWSRLKTSPRPKRRREPDAEPLLTYLRAIGKYRYWSQSSAFTQRSRGWLEPLLLALGGIDPIVNTNFFLDEALRLQPDPERPPPTEMRDALVRRLDEIREECRALGAALVVMLIPDAIQANPPRFAEFLRIQGEPAAAFDRTAFHDSFVVKLTAEGFEVVDLLPVLEAEVEAGRDGYLQEGHFNAHGHALAAEHLIPVLHSALR